MPFPKGRNDATMFKPGQSGNLSGRPKGHHISYYLKRLLVSKIPPQILMTPAFKALKIKGSEKLTTAELMALMNVIAVFYKMTPTQIKALEMIQDRTEGKARQEVLIDDVGRKTIGDLFPKELTSG